MEHRSNMNALQGIPASPGIGIGPAVWRRKERPSVVRTTILETDLETETLRLRKAVELANLQIEKLRELTAKQVGEQEAQIFDAHQAFLADPAYVGTMLERIRSQRLNAEFICEQVTEETRQMLSQLPDEYLQARADDIRDVGDRLLSLLAGSPQFEAVTLPINAIVVAEELAPSDLAHLPTTIAGIVTARGSKTGHVAIMARTLGIPAVLGLQSKLSEISDGDTVIVDGDQGIIMVRPDAKVEQQMQEQWRTSVQTRESARKRATQQARTADGEEVQVFVNIGNLKDVDEALENGAEGVGLFRTEFLYIENDHWPTEDEQFETYKTVLERFAGCPVIIRTLDIGGDKELPYATLPKEDNPFLGHRGLRFCLGNPEVFKIQLRALLRASRHGTLWIMLPMVSTIEEVRQAKALLAECKGELQTEDVLEFGEIALGIMVETPAAAVMADVLAREVDFMSIGTNDLTQYTLAADRGNELVAHLYQSHHPAVLRLIRMVCEAGKRAGIPVSVCGELAGESNFTQVLLGLGVKELSMSSQSIPGVKDSVRQVDMRKAQAIAGDVLVQEDAAAVDAWLQDHTEEDA